MCLKIKDKKFIYLFLVIDIANNKLKNVSITENKDISLELRIF